MGKQLFPLVQKSQLVPSSFYKKEKNHLLSFTSSLCFYHVFHRLLIKFVKTTYKGPPLKGTFFGRAVMRLSSQT